MADRYNGWTNRETWSVALWIGNDEGLYRLAKDCASQDRRSPYRAFLAAMEDAGSWRNGDGIAWTSRLVNRREINSMMREL